MKKIKLNKWAYRILKIIWFSIGGLILLWTIFFFVKMYTIKTLGVIATALLFAVGIYYLIIFISITLLFLLIKWIVKKWIRKK